MGVGRVLCQFPEEVCCTGILARRIANSYLNRMRMTANRRTTTNDRTRMTSMSDPAILGAMIRPGIALGDDLNRCYLNDRRVNE